MVATLVIGTGHWGKNLVRNFNALGALGGFCETDSEQRAAISAQYPDARAFDSLETALSTPDIDSVAIATPAVTHGEIVRQALAAGKHVFVEKPLCLDLETGTELQRQAEASGLTLMVGHMLRYHPAFVALLAHVESGAIGTPRYIYSNRLSLGKLRREENALWSFAPHDTSMILALAGRMPTKVVTNGLAHLTPGVADTTLTHMSFGDTLQAHIHVSWLHPYKEQRLVVIGDKGMVVFNDVEPGANKLLRYPHVVGWVNDLPTVNKAEADPIPYAEGEPLRLECMHFLDCVDNGRQPVTDAEEGLRVLKVLDACHRALLSGTSIAP